MKEKRKVTHSLIKEDLERVIDKDTPFAISESFRMLHTNILYLPIDDKCRRIAYSTISPTRYPSGSSSSSTKVKSGSSSVGRNAA